MSARFDIEQDLVAKGWLALRDQDPHRLTYFRWLPGTLSTVREELNINFDKSGRVTAWTVWHNKRVVGPDQEKGTRKRLDELIANTVAH